MEIKQSDLKLSNLTLEILSGLVGEEIIDVLKKTLDALAKSPDGLSVFGSNSTSDKNGNFLIVPCNFDESGQLNVVFVGFLVDGSRTDDDYLLFEWKSQDIKLRVGSQTCTLNENLYAKLREEVSKKLGVNGSTYIKDLNITAHSRQPAGH